MKKTFVTCVAILALFAIAGTAGAITCTVDQRPAATLLIPRFAVSLNTDSTVDNSSPTAIDTLIAIGNASSAPMIAHVSVFNSRSTLVLDFNVALTGFDIQTWRMSDILSGILPSTPINKLHVGPDTSTDPSPDDACQRNPLAAVYPAGYLRVRPPCDVTDPVPPCQSSLAANPDDDNLATAAYPIPAWPAGSAFAKQVVDSLDDTPDSLGCGNGSVDGITAGNAVGYITVDHANYCSISNPSEAAYYAQDAIGNENNLFGDIIFLSHAGIGTYGMAAVAIESDPSMSAASAAAPTGPRTRTFYARYWDPTTETLCANCTDGPDGADNNLGAIAPWDEGFGDEREPLGLKWGARYFTNPGAVISSFDVWRAGKGSPSGSLVDLTDDGACDDVEPTVSLNFFDEDENGVSQIGPGPCPSPCSTPPPPTFNFPLETNRIFVTQFTLPAPEGAVNAGWVEMNFANAKTGSNLDQAYVSYEFDGGAAFISAHFTGLQLDPSSCEPLDIIRINSFTGAPDFPPINPVTPVIPGRVDGCFNSVDNFDVPCPFDHTTARVGVGP
ncbi:MAG TPA: hypothetical protein VEG84_06385 [Thermoanaerobaculia bacterium]|nr:hypothetical protein [Thermoanaerobaculia bacterium]